MSVEVVVDTSVRIGPFRQHNADLPLLMESDVVLMHPMVLLELACGTPPAPRARTLHDLNLLQPAHQASLDEVMAFIEPKSLYGLGCGLVDMALLASAFMTPRARLWTLDQRLETLARRFAVSHRPGLG